MMRNDVGCITVSPSQIEAWGVTVDRAFKDARQQTIWDEPRERRILARGDSKIVWVRANFFASSVLLVARSPAVTEEPIRGRGDGTLPRRTHLHRGHR